MAQIIKLNGIMYSKGDTITLNERAPSVCHATSGATVQIRKIRFDTPALVGLYSKEGFNKWSDLDGDVKPGHGWWIPTDRLEVCIEDCSGYEVINDINHKGTDLKGKHCYIVGRLEDGSVFVEFGEDVGGCSADGLGKAGHCIALSAKVLVKKKRLAEHAK